MNLELTGSTAVIIGGAKGIGLEMGKAFAGESANVVLVDIDASVVDVAPSLKNANPDSKSTCLGIACNATDYKKVKSVAHEINSQFPGKKHLVYAAGCGSGKFGFPFWNLEPKEWSRVIEVNLMGAVNVLHAFASNFVSNRSGTLLLVSSVAGQVGSQTDPPYSAAKAAMINFAQCAARDFAEFDVRVNILCPGMVATDINRSVWEAWNREQTADARLSYDQWGQQKVERLAPLGRWQTTQDMANMALFLASDRAKNITGQTMNVDGGQVMR